MAIKVTDSNGNTVKVAGRGLPGVSGRDGQDGKSAYDYAAAGGYTGTEAEFQVLMSSGPWIPATEKGSANGVATLNSSGKIPASQLSNVVNVMTLVKKHGWYRVLTINDSFGLIKISNEYSSYGGSDILISVSVTNFNKYPVFRVLGVRHVSGHTIDKIRVCELNVRQKCIDIHYAPDSQNTVAVWTNLMSRYDTPAIVSFDEVPDVPSETIVVPETVLTDTQNGIVSTSADLAAAIERGLSL